MNVLTGKGDWLRCILNRAINNDLEIEIITTQREMSRKYNLTLTNINRCLKGKQKQHKGWKFEYC